MVGKFLCMMVYIENQCLFTVMLKTFISKTVKNIIKMSFLQIYFFFMNVIFNLIKFKIRIGNDGFLLSFMVALSYDLNLKIYRSMLGWISRNINVEMLQFKISCIFVIIANGNHKLYFDFLDLLHLNFFISF